MYIVWYVGGNGLIKLRNDSDIKIVKNDNDNINDKNNDKVISVMKWKLGY